MAETERTSVAGVLCGRRTPIVLALAILLLAVAVTLRFPVYFRWDDVSYLRWAQTHPNPLFALRPAEAAFFGAFRPIPLLAWWLLFRAFGLRAPVYQLCLTLLYAAGFVVFFLLLQRLYGRRTAVLGLLGYMALFFPLGYIIFWFSDLGFVLELLFINLSLYCLLPAEGDSRRRQGWGLLFFLCAILSKEPSVLIITSVLVAHAWARWDSLSPDSRRRLLVTLGLVAATGLWWLAISPGFHDRQGLLKVAHGAGASRFLIERWSFYAATLQAHAGVLLWTGVLFAAFKSLLPRRFGLGMPVSSALLLLALTLGLALKGFPETALIVLLLASVACVTRRRDFAAGTIWGFLPLLGLLTLSYYGRTYLTEASFGLAVLLGMAGDEISQSFSGLRRWHAHRAVRVAAGLLLVAAVALFALMARGRLAALQVLSDNRQNFRDVSDHLLRNPLPRNARLAVVSSLDMAQSSSEGMQLAEDEERAGMQNTMESSHLPIWFRISGREDIRVFPTMQDCLQAKPDSCYVWVMNNHENRYLNRLPLRRTLIFEVHRRGEGAWLYLATR